MYHIACIHVPAGIDQEGDDVEMDVTGETPGVTPAGSPTGSDNEDEAKIEELAQEDNTELEEARRERMELLSAEKEALEEQRGNTAQVSTEDKLQYLVAQSDVFAHFLAGSVAAKQSSSKKGKKGGRSGKKGRMTEAEEDAQLMKTAQSRRRTVRLDKQPSNLSAHCKMHPYQLEGLNWLIKLHDHGINGILADEMGLGKTLQTISLLAYLREARGTRGPHVVIVPKSVLGNWCREFKKWCPCIRVVKMGGTKEERKHIVENELPKDAATGKHKFDVLVTTYEAMLKEKGKLGRVKWKYLIIDEAHRIKNENSSLSKVVRTMDTEFRVLITGTPLQNNLHELWALLNFLLPEIFGDADQFDAWFNVSGEAGQENVIKKLHTVLRPFMLRRVKKDVACGLPPKKETKLFIGLTAMQQQWYKKLLSKDAHELNALGGPTKVRLLNILMQLRKVCNHPYLFDGAEAGPPFTDGPHLWENCGKMALLHKLLPKLKAKGSRVLIFTQMTRVIDIMEDYMRLNDFKYCRIDGNTSGESRDSQMDEFNAPNSEKFCFILSTRAGGLGINLATADIVILYDSDWNPQVDLQAMDRAHRIGQTKPVQVFRFVADGTVEEKIMERADRKLFLDAAVIQQGRLAEQNTSLGKDDLMKMVQFGADQILQSKGGTYTDEDIDGLIAKGEERTSEMQAKLQSGKHDLANFSLVADDGGPDTFSFEGENYREKAASGNFINLPQRQRKRNYDVNEYFRDAMNQGGSSEMRAHAVAAAKAKKRKGPVYKDFQLYDRDRLEQLSQVEREIAAKKVDQIQLIEVFRKKARMAASLHNARVSVSTGESMEELNKQADVLEARLDLDFKLSPKDQAEKRKLEAEGFPDWDRKDFKAFCSALEHHGRYDVVSIVDDVAAECGKSEADVKRYFVAFWLNYQRISDWKRVIERIEKGEKKILRLRQIRDAINDKIERHLDDKYFAIYESFGEDKVAEMEKEVMGAAVPKSPATPGNYASQSPKGTPAKLRIPTPNELLDYTWQTIKFNYGPSKGYRSYTEEEDAFLLYMMYKHGYGMAERIRMSIRRAVQFRFDWFFKSRNAQEIQKRCDAVVRMVEKENDEVRKVEEKERLEEEVLRASAESETETQLQQNAPQQTSPQPGAEAEPQPMEIVVE